MLEQHQPFISAKKTLILAVSGFPGKLHVCNNRCSNHRTLTNVDFLKKC